MVLGATIGALGNIGASIASNAISSASNAKLMKLQSALNYFYARKSALNQPSWNRQGLQDAGYNPMLAVQNATSGANSNWSGLNSVENPGLSDALSAGISNAQSFKHLENETKTAESQAEANEATAKNQNAQANNAIEENPYIADRAKAEISKLESDTSLNSATIENMKSRLELDRMLGLMGIQTQRYGIDKAYNASTYATNVKAETERGTISTHNPFGLGSTTKYYQPDDVLRMPHKYHDKSYIDVDDRRYWHYY